MPDEIADSAPISLYFQVPHNEAVSLEAIARAALAWDALIKELAAVLDPSLDIPFIPFTHPLSVCGFPHNEGMFH